MRVLCGGDPRRHGAGQNTNSAVGKGGARGCSNSPHPHSSRHITPRGYDLRTPSLAHASVAGWLLGLPPLLHPAGDRRDLPRGRDNHDRCWAKCAQGPVGPQLGLAHRQQCDLDLLYYMETACVLEAALIVFPTGGIGNAHDFIEYCTATAATFYAAVASPPATPIFWASQCIRGCNGDACATLAASIPLTCGHGFGPYFCYLMPEPPPQPPPNFCSFVDCAEACHPAGSAAFFARVALLRDA